MAGQAGQRGQHLAAIFGQHDLALGALRGWLVPVRRTDAAGDGAAAQYRPAAVEHRRADVGQHRVRRGDLAPARVQAGVHVLHDVFGGGQVPHHEQGEPDQLAVVLAEERGDRSRRPIRCGFRRHQASVSHRFRPSGGWLRNRSMSHT